MEKLNSQIGRGSEMKVLCNGIDRTPIEINTIGGLSDFQKQEMERIGSDPNFDFFCSSFERDSFRDYHGPVMLLYFMKDLHLVGTRIGVNRILSYYRCPNPCSQ